MPPERKAPSGTSLSRRSLTACASIASSSASTSRSGRLSLSNSVTSQYCRVVDPTVRDVQPVPGFELPDVPVHGGRRQEVAEREIAFERREVERGVPRRALVEALHLAREVQRAAQDGVEQRLLAEPIAGGEHLALPAVVDREREHPLQAVEAAGAVLFVGVEDRFGVRARPEDVAPGIEVARAGRGGCRSRR